MGVADYKFPVGTYLFYHTRGREPEFGVVSGHTSIGVFVRFGTDTGSKLCTQDIFTVREWQAMEDRKIVADLEEIDE